MRYFGLTLLGLGLFISAYLLYRHFGLIAGGSGTDVCSAMFGVGCDEALRSPLSSQLGLPLAGWGVVYYVTLSSLLLLGWGLGEGFRFEAATVAVFVSLVGAILSAVLGGAMILGKAPFCPLCVALQVINLVLVAPLLAMTGRPPREVGRAVASGVKYVFGAKVADADQAPWKVTALILPALVAVVAYQWVLIQEGIRVRAAGGPFDPAQALVAYEATPAQDIPVSVQDAAIGPDDAPAELIVFSDFQCPACTAFAVQLEELRQRFAGQLRVVFKHYPLDPACNAVMEFALHPQACEAARAAEAARLQGKFWPFHDALFDADLGAEGDGITEAAEALGLDLMQFQADRNGPVAAAKVEADIELGTRLGITSTPSVFLNGRQLYDTRPDAVLFLIAHMTDSHGQAPGFTGLLSQ